MENWELDSKERLKVLPHITVVVLQAAFTRGFRQLGHRDLRHLFPHLQGMNWNTAPFKHLQAFVLLESVLVSLLEVYHNGLIPDRMTLLALKGVNEEAPFVLPENVNFCGVASFLSLKLRQMASKFRCLVSSGGQWESLAKKLTSQEHKFLLRFCRCLDANFLQTEQARYLFPLPHCVQCPFRSPRFHMSVCRRRTVSRQQSGRPWRGPLVQLWPHGQNRSRRERWTKSSASCKPLGVFFFPLNPF